MSALLFLSALLLGSVSAGSEAVPERMLDMPLLLNETFEEGAARWEPSDREAFAVIEENGNHVYAVLKNSFYEPPVRSPVNIATLKDLTVGYQDPSHYYYVHFGLKSDPHSNSIFLVNGEPRVSIARSRTGGTRWLDDTYHRVRIVRDVKSGTIKVYFDDMGTPAMTAQDTTLKEGRFGVGSFDDTGNIDDYRIWGVKVKK